MNLCIVKAIGTRVRLAELVLDPRCPQAELRRDTVTVDWGDGIGILFSYGILVLWGTDEKQRQLLEAVSHDYVEEPQTSREEERYPFTIDAARAGMRLDHIYLKGDSPEERLAISHGLAQSLQLNLFEERIEQAVRETAAIPRNMADKGKSLLSRRAIAQQRGRLYLVRAHINLRSDLLDVPEFFWDHPELQPYYEQAIGYLELDSRVEVLNKRLSVLQELFEMLADEQKHKHSSLLEWIIIWLIAIEIVIFLYEDFVAPLLG